MLQSAITLFSKSMSSADLYKIGGILNAMEVFILQAQGPFKDNFWNFHHAGQTPNNTYSDLEKMTVVNPPQTITAANVTGFQNLYNNWCTVAAPTTLSSTYTNCMITILANAQKDCGKIFDSKAQNHLTGFSNFMFVVQQTLFPQIDPGTIKSLMTHASGQNQLACSGDITAIQFQFGQI